MSGLPTDTDLSSDKEEKAAGGKRKSPWLSHVKKTMKSEAGKKKTMGKKWFSHVLKTAKKTYKKHGGAEEGGRRHGARRTRRR